MKAVSKLKYIYDGVTPYPELSHLGKLTRIVVLGIRFFFDGDSGRQATALTYYTLFAVVPIAALFFGIAKGFGLENILRQELFERFSEHQSTLEWLCHFVDNTLHRARGGVVAGVGVVLLFGTVIMLANNIEETFNRIWGIRKRRNIFHKMSDYLAMMVVTPILLIVVSGSTAVTRMVLLDLARQLPLLSHGAVVMLEMMIRLVPLVVAWVVFCFIYYVVPNTKVRLSSALIAALFAGTLFFALQNALLYLQFALSGYNAIYGSFAIVPLFLLWLQWSWQIVLFGAELTFVHQNAATGQFEKTHIKFSRRLQRHYLFALIRLVCRNFEAGRGGTRESEIVAKLHLTVYQVRMYLNELIDCRILISSGSENGETAYLPALPPSQLTVMKVFQMLDCAGENAAAEHTHALLANLTSQCEKIEQAAAASASNRPLKDL